MLMEMRNGFENGWKMNTISDNYGENLKFKQGFKEISKLGNEDGMILY